MAAFSGTNAFKKHPLLGLLIYIPAGVAIGAAINLHKHNWDRALVEWKEFVSFAGLSAFATWMLFYLYFLLVRTPYDMQKEAEQKIPKLPKIEILMAKLRWIAHGTKKEVWYWEFSSKLFVTTATPVTIPRHMVTAEMVVRTIDGTWNRDQKCMLDQLIAIPPGEGSSKFQASLNGHGRLVVSGLSKSEALPDEKQSPIEKEIAVSLAVGIAGGADPVRLIVPLHRHGNDILWQTSGAMVPEGDGW